MFTYRKNNRFQKKSIGLATYGPGQVVCLYGTEAAQIPELIVGLCQLPRRIHPCLLETFQAGQLKAHVFIAK